MFPCQVRTFGLIPYIEPIPNLHSRVSKEVVGLSAPKVRSSSYTKIPLIILGRLICIRVGALTSGRGSRYVLAFLFYFVTNLF